MALPGSSLMYHVVRGQEGFFQLDFIIFQWKFIKGEDADLYAIQNVSTNQYLTPEGLSKDPYFWRIRYKNPAFMFVYAFCVFYFH